MTLLSILGAIWLAGFLLILGELARGYAAHRGKSKAKASSSRKAQAQGRRPMVLPVYENPSQIPFRDAA
jgi:hypothetical protein